MSSIAINKYLEKWAIFGLIVFLLGFYFISSSKIHNTVFYIAVCTPIVLLLPTYFKRLAPKSWLTFSAVIFSFYLFLNSWWAIDFSVGKSLKYLKYLFILYCLFAAVFLFKYKRPVSTKTLFIALMVVGSLSSIYGIYDHFNTIHLRPLDPLAYRYNDPIHSAMLAGLLLLTCLWFMIESTRYKHKLYYFILSIPFITLIILSKARGPELAFLITLLPIGYFQFTNIKRHAKLISISLLLFIILLTLILTSDFSQGLLSKGFSLPYRPDIWSGSLQEALDSFWFGQGATRKPSPLMASGIAFNHSHNIALAIFRMGGIVGLMLFFTTLALCLSAGLKSKKSIDHLWIIWLFFGFVCLMTNGKYPLTRPSTSWLAFWVPMAFVCASFSNFLVIKKAA